MKKYRISFIPLYLLLCLLLGTGLLLCLFGQKQSRVSDRENRMLSGFPEVSWESITSGTFMTGLESWLSDSMFERDAIIDVSNTFMEAIALWVPEKTDDEKLEEQVAAMAGVDDGSKEEEGPLPSAEPSPEPSLEPTLEPSPEAALESTPEPSLEPAASPAETPLQAPTPTPKAVKLTAVDHDCTLWQERADGTVRTVYTFEKKEMQNAVEVLNAYRNLLPEDGKVFFTHVPFPGISHPLQRGMYVGWGSDVEKTLEEYVQEGVVIVSTQKVLEQPLLDGEALWFHTDHHWTPRAACYVAQALLKTQGIAAASYEDYSYVHYTDFVGSTGAQPGYSKEPIDVILPLLPTTGYLIDKTGREKEDVYMVTTRHSYQAYLGSTRGPWRKFVTGADGADRKCLVISDSYGNCFIPYLMPYYSEVHSVDLRADYFSLSIAGCTVSEYIADHGIDEVYIILSTASGINSGYMNNYLWKYL